MTSTVKPSLGPNVFDFFFADYHTVSAIVVLMVFAYFYYKFIKTLGGPPSYGR